MPIVPASLPAAPDIAQLPGIRTPSADPDAFGAGLARGLSSIGQAAASISTDLQRHQARRDAEDADRALTAWTAEAYSIQDGRLDPATGQTTPGIASRKYAAATGAAKEWSETERKWIDDPSSPYAALTPAARKIFEQHRAPAFQRLTERMITHELNQTEAQRAIDRDSAFAIRDKAVTNAIGTPEHEARIPEAATRYAIRELKGMVSLDADDKPVFAPGTQPLYEAAVAAYTETKRLEAISVLASRAEDATLDPAGEKQAAAYLADASAKIAMLPSTTAEKAKDLTDRVLSNRTSRTKAAINEAEHAALVAQRDFRTKIDQFDNEASRTGYADIPGTIRQIDDHTTKSGTAADYAYATNKRQELLALAARRAEGDRKNLNEAKARQIQTALGTGSGIDASGQPFYWSPQERVFRAKLAYLQRDIDEDTWKSLTAAAHADQNKRLGQFHYDATKSLIPLLPEAAQKVSLFELDKTQDRVTINQDPKLKLKFDTDSGIKRNYTDTQKQAQHDHIYLGQIADALNMYRERLQIDPDYTPTAALADFKEFISPATEEHTKISAVRALRQQATTLADVRKNFETNQNKIIYKPKGEPK